MSSYLYQSFSFGWLWYFHYYNHVNSVYCPLLELLPGYIISSLFHLLKSFPTLQQPVNTCDQTCQANHSIFFLSPPSSYSNLEWIQSRLKHMLSWDFPSLIAHFGGTHPLTASWEMKYRGGKILLYSVLTLNL